MAGPYLIGIDCGTQSAKVVVFDAHGQRVAEGRQALRPMRRPAHGVAVHPDDDLWDSIAAAMPPGARRIHRRPERDRRRRALHDSLLQGVPPRPTARSSSR